MPRFDSQGRAISGVGDNIVSADGVEIGRGGGACPRDGSRVVYGGVHEGRWKLLEGGALLQDRPVLEIAAGGGHYLARDPNGLFGSLAVPASFTHFTPTATDGRGAASRDGYFAVTDGTGQGFAIVDPDGGCTERFFTGIPAYDVTVVGAGQASLSVAGTIKTIGLPEPVHLGRSGRACWCSIGGVNYIVHYLEGRGLVARRADSDQGKVIESAPIFFHYDAMAWNGAIRVCYSRTAAERPEDLIVRDITVSELTERLIDQQAPTPIGPAPETPATPQPQPEHPPMPSSKLPADVTAIRDRYVQKFPVPQMAQGPADEAFENTCRGWVKRLAEQIVFSTGDRSWGVKRAGEGRPQSKDALARHQQSRLTGFDLLLGVGTGKPALVAEPSGEEIAGQIFMAVEPADHLGSTGGGHARPDVPEPSSGTAVTIDLGPILEAALAPLRAEIKALRAHVESLQRPTQGTFPKKIALKSAHDRYLSIEPDGKIVVDRESVGAWETVSVEVVE